MVDNFSGMQCRLERNQEREKGVSNMEYLKNVVLKVWIEEICNHFAYQYLCMIS